MARDRTETVREVVTALEQMDCVSEIRTVEESCGAIDFSLAGALSSNTIEKIIPEDHGYQLVVTEESFTSLYIDK